MTPTIQDLLTRADDVRKAAPARADADAARDAVLGLLKRARERLPDVADETERLDLAAAIARRVADLDREEVVTMLGATPDVAPAPTRDVDPARVPPGQHLTAGWPVLHVGRAPDTDPADWRLTVTGRVATRLVLDLDALRELETVTLTRDFHCVTGWSRLDNTWTGVRAAELIERAGARPEATHALVTGHPAYSANLDLPTLRADDVLFAWAHDGRQLDVAHGGPLRLVVPSRYGWKSVKWAFELKLIERDVRGYWEERGYHDVGEPFAEQRFRGD